MGYMYEFHVFVDMTTVGVILIDWRADFEFYDRNICNNKNNLHKSMITFLFRSAMFYIAGQTEVSSHDWKPV